MNKKIYNKLTSFVGTEHSSSNFLNSLQYKDNAKRLINIITDLKKIFDIEIREGFKAPELVDDKVIELEREEDKKFKSCKLECDNKNLTSVIEYIEDNYIDEINNIEVKNNLVYIVLK